MKKFSKKYLENAYVEGVKKTINFSDKWIHGLSKDLIGCKGTILCCGIGKSGIVAKKMYASLASVGLKTQYINAGEALHGDLGLISKKDIFVCISKSGETPEIISVVNALKSKFKIQINTITSNPNSYLASVSKCIVLIPENELEPATKMPLLSFTCQSLAVDMLIYNINNIINFTNDDFKLNHPGGFLGKYDLMKVKDVMEIGKKLPIVNINTNIDDVVSEMLSKKRGFVIVKNKSKLVGVITDADILRRSSSKSNLKIAKELMTKNPFTCVQSDGFGDIRKVMLEKRITKTVVVNDSFQPIGLVDIYNEQ